MSGFADLNIPPPSCRFGRKHNIFRHLTYYQ